MPTLKPHELIFNLTGIMDNIYEKMPLNLPTTKLVHKNLSKL